MAKRIGIADRPKRRIEPENLATALGANPARHRTVRNLDAIGLAELGAQLVGRLRSSGGRPALIDATETCRVPLSAEDLDVLGALAARIAESSGAKPSVGQLVSVIVHNQLNAFADASIPAVRTNEPGHDVATPLTTAILQQMIDEQVAPLHDKVKRLERALHVGSAGGE